MCKCKFKTYCKDCNYKNECRTKGFGEKDGCCNGHPDYPDSAGWCDTNREIKCKFNPNNVN